MCRLQMSLTLRRVRFRPHVFSGQELHLISMHWEAGQALHLTRKFIFVVSAQRQYVRRTLLYQTLKAVPFPIPKHSHPVLIRCKCRHCSKSIRTFRMYWDNYFRVCQTYQFFNRFHISMSAGMQLFHSMVSDKFFYLRVGMFSFQISRPFYLISL